MKQRQMPALFTDRISAAMISFQMAGAKAPAALHCDCHSVI